MSNKTWSEIFTEFELNQNFLLDKLQKRKTKEEIIAVQDDNSAKATEAMMRFQIKFGCFELVGKL